jgi:TolB-like protein/DNA-binding winged helix-turn-helix (wHTH) protein/Tfp pilus assembly protein PilF
MDDPRARAYCFESFRLDPRSRELHGPDGALVPLTAKAFDTLLYLVEQRHRLVGKDELLAAVWPGRVVEENNLSQAISALRRALGTDAREHRFLVTVPGRGYRFVAEVRDGPVPDAEPNLRAIPDSPGTVAAADRAAPRAPGAGHAAWLGALLFLGALAGVVAWRWIAPDTPPSTPAAVAAPVALAVLPFRPLSPDADDPLLALGLADTLVTRLGRSPGLRVRALASARRLEGAGAAASDATAAARALGADYVVEGSTQRQGERLRVNARLLAADDGRVLWAETFDTGDERVFTLQDRIGDAVIAALALRPLPVPARPPSPCDGDDAGAYRALLRAHYLQHRRDPGTIPAYHDAIRHDPTCSRAYAGMAIAYMFMAHNDAAPREVFPLARAAIDRALQLDPDAPEALVAHGRYLQLHAWDWPASEAALRRAIARAPSLAEAHFALAHLLVTTGRFEEGLREAAQARELDPLSPFINALEGGFLSAAGRPAEAQVRLRHALELEPDFWIALLVRGGLALDQGEPAAAIADLQRASERTGGASQVLAVLAAAHIAAGERAAAAAVLEDLQDRASQAYVPPISLAAVHLALGDRAGALDLLERARDERDIRIAFLQVDARWNGVRDEPRFQALARSLGLHGGAASGRF